MAKKNFLAALQDMEGAVVGEFNPHASVISSPSPSMNFIYGNGQGLPRGFGEIRFGPPRGGKTIACNANAGQVHRDYPEGYVVKFDCEFREKAQMSPHMLANVYGIDPKRYICFQVNDPVSVFDRIEKDIAALCDDGMDLPLIIIDSLNGIQGRRSLNADTIETQQIGDRALTLQEGFARILKVQRKHNIAIIATAHVRAEMDMIEQKRGNKVKMAQSYGVRHWAEYYMYTEPFLSKSKGSDKDALGNTFEDSSVKDFADRAEQTGHKIRVTMKDSSLGPKGRVGIFTFDYHRGIINTHEEVFFLGTRRGVIERVNQSTFAFGDQKWTGGAPAMLEALRTNPDLSRAVLAELRARDIAGNYSHVNEDDET